MIQSMDRGQFEADAFESQGQNNEADFLAIMLRRKWVILFVALLGLGAGYLHFQKTPARYESTAQLLVIHKHPVMPTGRMMSSADYENILTDNILSTQMTVIRSPMIVRRAVIKDNLHTLVSMKDFAPGEAIGDVTRNLILSRGGRTTADENASVINVSFRSANPKDAQAVVASIIDTYESFLQETRRNVSEDLVARINYAKDKLHKDLESKELQYNTWRKLAPATYFLGGDTNGAASRAGSFEHAVAQAEVRLIDLRATVRILEEGLRDGVVREALIQIVGRNHGADTRALNPDRNDTAAILQTQLFPLLIREQQLIERLNDNHPDVKVVRQQIEMLQQLIMPDMRGEERMTPTQFLNIHLDSLRQEIKKQEEILAGLEKNLDIQREAAKETLNYIAENDTHKAGIDRVKRMFDEVMQRMHEVAVVQDIGGYEVRRLSDPYEGVHVQPVLTRSLAIGGVLGLLLGIALGYVIDLADKSFRTPDEIRKEMHLPVIGHIPVIEPASRTWRKKVKAGEIATKVDETVVCFHHPRSAVSEAYRSIRTALYFGVGGEEHKVIQVTSADAGDGKTTMAVNLAVSIAQSGRRVCLIDADFRRSRIHSIFGIDPSIGISSVIQGKAELPDAICRTEVENLYLLPCGPRPANPAELLTSHRFKELLDVLRTKFDTIILDTPPMLAVTDPSAVAPRADSVLLVLRITKNVRPNALRAKQVLDSLDARVVGIVVNGVEVRTGYGQDSGYRRYSSGGYGYGYRDYGATSYYSNDGNGSAEPSFSEVAVSSRSNGAPRQRL